jgi:hypothetical protein
MTTVWEHWRSSQAGLHPSRRIGRVLVLGGGLAMFAGAMGARPALREMMLPAAAFPVLAGLVLLVDGRAMRTTALALSMFLAAWTLCAGIVSDPPVPQPGGGTTAMGVLSILGAIAASAGAAAVSLRRSAAARGGPWWNRDGRWVLSAVLLATLLLGFVWCAFFAYIVVTFPKGSLFN